MRARSRVMGTRCSARVPRRLGFVAGGAAGTAAGAGESAAGGFETPGVGASGASFASKTGKFFPWVAAQPQWAPLATFEPLVTALDQLRTPEVHNLSRVRADFTRLVLRPIDQCVELLQRVLRYVFDHITAVIAPGRAPCYDASAGTAVTT